MCQFRSCAYIHRLLLVKCLYACSIEILAQVSACLLAGMKEEHEQSLQSLWKLPLVAVLAHLSETAAVLEDPFQQSFS